MRFLAVDLGDKRTGLAIGDDQTGAELVSALVVIESPIAVRGGEALIADLRRAVDEHLGLSPSAAVRATRGLVFGLPINMDGTEGTRAVMVRAFAARVGAACGLEVFFQDERLTSFEAEKSIAGSGMTRGEKKSRRDAIAAAVFLRDFLRMRAQAGGQLPHS
jgi:putative holliday junction resolvase